MKNKIRQALHFINYKLTAYTEHDLHSPFLYRFYTDLIKEKYAFADFEILNQLRSLLLANSTEIEMIDLGAGSKKLKSSRRPICDIAKHGIARKKQAEFLYRLLHHYTPKTLVELGTSVGLSTLYFSKALPESNIYTIEGCPDLFQFSSQFFKENKGTNITSIYGNFNQEFPQLLSHLNGLDFLYIDGNHAYEPTMRYFKLALEKKESHSIFVFDDIHWSMDMEKAWVEICAHPEVRISLDLFYFGILFFRKETMNKEHFVLNF